MVAQRHRGLWPHSSRGQESSSDLKAEPAPEGPAMSRSGGEASEIPVTGKGPAQHSWELWHPDWLGDWSSSSY